MTTENQKSASVLAQAWKYLPQAKQGNVVKGAKLVPDGGFSCMGAFQSREVFADTIGRLYVFCDHGGCLNNRHYLDGQLNALGEYVGLKVAP